MDGQLLAEAANPVDLEALARRVVARLRPPPELKEDLIQQALLVSIDLLRRFQPRSGPDEPEARLQTERYLAVSLRWHLRAYVRDLRSPLILSDRGHRLGQAYRRLAAEEGSITIAEAAKRLAVDSTRLSAVLNALAAAESLDRPDRGRAAGDAVPLGERVAAAGPGTDDLALAAIDRERQSRRGALSEADPATANPPSGFTRQRQARALLDRRLDRLTDGDAEVIRLAFALPRQEVGGLRSCRAYGCRKDSEHEHPPRQIARWVGIDERSLAERLSDALGELKDQLGNRDPRRLLREISRAGSASTLREHP